MRKKIHIKVLVGILLYAASGMFHAQGQTLGNINQNSQSFIQKVNMSNVGNKDGTYYLLLCKLLPNATSKIMGAITLEFSIQDSIPNVCNIEVNVSADPLSGNSYYIINNLCDVVRTRLLIVQYGREEYIAVELIGIINVSDISFTGYAENKSLLLVNENQVAIIDDTISNGTRAGDPWDISGNNIYNTNSGHVGIGTSLIDNSQSWHRVLDIYGTYHAKLLVRSPNIKTGIFSHESWSGTVGRIGTESSHDLRLMAGYGKDVMTLKTDGNVGIGTTNPAVKLHVVGNTYLGATASIGKSGNQFDEFGYNIEFTGTTDDYKYRVNNPAASIRMGQSGSIQFRTAPSGTAGANFTFTERMRIMLNGNVGIGTTSPDYKLDVVGTIRAHEVLVNTQKTADFVFDDDFRLRSLNEVEQFITENKHLPDIAPAVEMEQNGLNMGEFQIRLLQKIEELTLYVIELKKENEAQQKEIEKLKIINQ